ncbi:MAG: carboxypeptidase regulatory-like domain-containing protein [Rickettsiales bacterium]|nr:carboxypeptidase regulatory-like domain-containing protein [Rickettsiales bacterium]
MNVFANEKITKEFNDFTLAIVQVNINNIAIDEYIDSYDTLYNHYFSLSGLTQSLGFDISYDLFSANANGWVYEKDNLFIINGNKRQITIGTKDYVISPEKFIYYDGEIYITIDEFARVFEMRYVYSDQDLLVQLYTDKVTPAEQRFLLQAKYKKLKTQKLLTKEKLEPDIVFNYQFFSAPTVNFNADIDYDIINSNVSEAQSSVPNDKDFSGNIAAYFRNNLLYMNSELYMNYDAEDNIDSKLFKVFKDDREDKLLGFLEASEYELGDLSNDAGQGVGFSFSNKSLYDVNDLGDTKISGTSFPGWQVELYVNDLFVAVQEVGADGRYDFENVQLGYRNNYIEIVKYGENGEIEREVRRYNLSTNILQSDRVYYDIQYLKSNEYLLGDQNDEDDVNDVESSYNNYFITFGKKINKNNSIYIQTRRDDNDIEDDKIYLANMIGASLNFIEFTNDNKNDARQLRLSSAVDKVDQGVNYDLQYRYRESEDGYFQAISGSYYKKYEKFNYNIDFSLIDNDGEAESAFDTRSRYNFDNCIEVFNNNDYDEDETNTELGVRCFLTQQWLSTSSKYNFRPDATLNNFNFQYHKDFGRKIDYDLRIFLTKINDDDNWTYNNELEYKIYSIFKTGLFLDYYDTNDELAFGLSFSADGQFSLVDNPYSPVKYSFLGQQNNKQGILGIRSYIDLNYNEYFDSEDELITGVGFTGAGTTNKVNAFGGVSYFSNLSQYAVYPVTIDFNKFDYVDLTPLKEVINIKIMPSKVDYIDYQFVYYGIADGYLTLKNNPLSGTRLVLKSSSGETLQEYITEKDGYFYFQNLKIGNYKIEIADTSYQVLEMKEQIDFGFQITKDFLFAEYLDIDIFGKVSDKVQNYILGIDQESQPNIEPLVKDDEVIIADSSNILDGETEIMQDEDGIVKVSEPIMSVKPISKPVNIAIFDILPKLRPSAKAVMFNPITVASDANYGFQPLKIYRDTETDKTQSVSINDLPESELLFGFNNDNKGLFEVEIAESNLKSEIVNYMIGFKRTYPQIFMTLAMKIRMIENTDSYVYKLKTVFKNQASEAINYCSDIQNIKCNVEKEIKIVGNFASKSDAYNFKTKLAMEGALENKEFHIKKIVESTETEINDINHKDKAKAINEYVTYLGGASYELLITSENLFDRSVEKFCDKYANVLECEVKFIANHGVESNKFALKAKGLSKPYQIDIYDTEKQENINYILTTGEFTNSNESFDFCNSIGIDETKCVVYKRSKAAFSLRK